MYILFVLLAFPWFPTSKTRQIATVLSPLPPVHPPGPERRIHDISIPLYRYPRLLFSVFPTSHDEDTTYRRRFIGTSPTVYSDSHYQNLDNISALPFVAPSDSSPYFAAILSLAAVFRRSSLPLASPQFNCSIRILPALNDEETTNCRRFIPPPSCCVFPPRMTKTRHIDSVLSAPPDGVLYSTKPWTTCVGTRLTVSSSSEYFGAVLSPAAPFHGWYSR